MNWECMEKEELASIKRLGYNNVVIIDYIYTRIDANHAVMYTKGVIQWKVELLRFTHL
ncbi:MAG: hypothetical protein K0R46_2406 [Herbinix sp.]|nr:hypothetical protein [Herbinix sp.]